MAGTLKVLPHQALLRSRRPCCSSHSAHGFRFALASARIRTKPFQIQYMWNPIHCVGRLCCCVAGSRVPIGYWDATMTTTAIIFDFCCVRLRPPLISVFRGNNWLSPKCQQWSTRRIVEHCIHCVCDERVLVCSLAGINFPFGSFF